MENSPAPTMSDPRYEPPRFRSVTTRRGINGFATRFSITTKATSKAIEAARKPRVWPSVHPCVAA